MGRLMQRRGDRAQQLEGERVLPPPGSCDCHAHIFGPHRRYAMSGQRDYTPDEASASFYRRALDELGIERAVLVQPSIYGFDNSCQLDAMAELGAEVRAVVAIDPATPASELERMHQIGVRGVRANLVLKGGPGLPDLLAVAERIGTLGWHLDLQISLDGLPSLQRLIAEYSLPLVLDHLGGWHPGASDAETDALLRLIQRPNVWVKLSSFYRLSRQGPPYDDIAGFASRLITDVGDRLVWGSDWPHPMHQDPVDLDLLVACVMDWCGGSAAQQQLFVRNPAQLYDFSVPEEGR